METIFTEVSFPSFQAMSKTKPPRALQSFDFAGRPCFGQRGQQTNLVFVALEQHFRHPGGDALNALIALE